MAEQTGAWRSVGVVLGWQVAASTCYYAVFAATPFIRDAFGASRATIGFLVATLMFGYTVLLFPSGALVDGYGEKPVMLVALAGLAVGAVAVTFAGSLPALFLAVFVLGAAYAPSMPTTNRAVAAVAPPGRTGVAMGIKQVGVTAGSGIAAILVAVVAPAILVWQLGFWTAAAGALLAAVVFAVTYRGTTGSGALAFPDLRGLTENRGYVLLVSGGFFLGAALFTTLGYVTLYLHDGVGTTIALAGVGLALMQVTGSLGRIGSGWVADRLPGTPAGAAARVLTAQAAVAAVVLVGLGVTDGTAVAIALVAVLGLSLFGFIGLFYACMTALVDDTEIGAATAGGQTLLNVGAILSPPAFGAVADATGYETAWVLLAGTAVIATALFAAIARREA